MQTLGQLLARAAEGEARPQPAWGGVAAHVPTPASVDLIARAGPAMILQHELQFGRVPTDTEIVDIVDILLPPTLRIR